ncbi:cinnamoyl-CoA reductase-like SNL6 isoform X2 [Argentina anserina]|uniref:cinnamoyl-CoA reductase-like SNL6 isoform X2 n=1 Tax=Argentina anserina TaxID=57926 RepID=UPI002176507F|nr:cinnamoyl-CoA reductase-like SNL6 isoform X2 [Potentilla anserina]
MGIASLQEREEDHELLQELRRMLVATAGQDKPQLPQKCFSSKSASTDDSEEKLVCVTSGVSFLSLAVVNCLLLRGYSVRIIVDNSVDVEKLREMTTANVNVTVVMAKLAEIESLSQAFQGCRGVFHTSGFTDPAGLSGYTKSMAEIEVKASENVMKACAVTPSVRKCVLTSSLVACVWQEQDNSQHDLFTMPVINHESWSNESLCIDKKLWYALGKLRSEKAAWTVAKENGLKLTTVCPGLITGPEFCSRNLTATIAYLKVAQEMFQNGVLATVDVMRLAEAHISVYEAMNASAFGRYICFDQVITTEREAEKLAGETSMSKTKICGHDGGSTDRHIRYELSNKKLTNLMSRTLRSCYNQNQQYY